MSGGFRTAARIALEDVQMTAAVDRATTRFREARAAALAELPDSDSLRDHFKRMRAATLKNLDIHLRVFRANARAAGAEVHFAADAAEARRLVLEIAKRHGADLAAKSKSMTTEEVHLNAALEAEGIRPVETDLGEWIVQLAEEPPAHIIAPAIQKTKEEVAGIFAGESGHEVDAEIPALTAHARARLREQFLAAGIGISGGNIAVAETGSLVLVTNEGNGRMVTTLPPVHVALIGIEKIAPDWDAAAAWLALLARSATGQPLSIYTNIITGPARKGEIDGPEEVHIILLDNGRRNLLGTKYEEILQCIRCGACLNICPVYRGVSGHAYTGENAPPSPYSGPIGAVITPLLLGRAEYKQLPQASSLCGACLDVCPARIDLPRMLIELRQDAVEDGLDSYPVSTATRLAASALADEDRLKRAARLARFGQVFVGRDLPKLAKQPFRDWWTAEGRPGGEAPLSAHLDWGPEPAQPPKTPALPAPWRSTRDFDDLPARFSAALEKAHGEVIRADSREEALEDARDLLRASGALTVVSTGTQAVGLAPGPRDPWRLERIEDYSNDGLLWRRICAGADAGVTEADALLAETGSAVVRSGPGLSRMVSLLPPLHIVLAPERLLTTDLFTWLAGREKDWPANTVLISGPSKTGDIEQTLAVGVHGPKRFVVVLYKEE